MRQGKYMIYKLYKKDINDYTLEFFLPDDDLKRKLNRVLTLASLKEKGYRIAGILYVDKESYLNARLAQSVQDYLYQDNAEHEVKKNFRQGLMSEEIAVKTLEMIQDMKWDLLKNIHRQVKRMVREDFDVENEIALMLCDQYLKAIL